MVITCLDLEGVLVPEIWIAFAEAANIPELKKTTRDEPDYDKLMKYRINILKEHGLGLKEIQDVIARRKGVFRRASFNVSGYHHQRHIHTVCTAPYEKAWLADYFL